MTKVELHEAYRGLVREELMPWCKGCGSHHVASMLWRFATIAAGARLDSQRRYRLTRPAKAPPPAEAARRFLSVYGPATPAGFVEWAGVAPAEGKRLWAELEDGGELIEVRAGKGAAWALAADEKQLGSPPQAAGTVLIPPGDPYLQKINRPLLAPDDALRKRLFRPVASPGVVLRDGRLAGMWRSKARGKRLEITVERTGRLAKGELEAEGARIAALRGAEPVLVIQ